VAEVLGIDPATIPDDANLIHLGVDSMGMLRLANRLRRVGIRAPFKELAAEPTLAAWQRQLARAYGH
jgi:aryl carrier-like protein